MKIKKIEVCGFKSFSDKVELGFPPGVTAIVGPNGCGKSNVVDAIRWALGEQSPKQLRGKAMEDVIFNGSENKKPLGMAEVVLTFANENGHPMPEYLDFSEISISRRLFRSGESEYYINKVPCRLKDITDLFLGTGVGHRAYSIVEQGRIDFIINAKPEERRFLLEEAAGITKYKDRKAAAQRKMEATQQNLLRLTDVIGEIKRQINSLNRQAKKAERFKEYREEIRAIELSQAAQTVRNLEAQRREIQAILQETQDREIKGKTEVSEVEASLEGIKVNLLDGEQDLISHQEALAENEGAIKDRETLIELSHRERENLKKQTSRAEEEINKLLTQQEAAEKEIKGLEEIGREHEEKIAQAAAIETEKEKNLFTKKTGLVEAEQALTQEKNSLIDLLTQTAHWKNRLSDLDRRSEELLFRQGKIAREKQEAEEKIEERQFLLAQKTFHLDAHRQARNQTEEERDRKVAQLKGLQAAQADLQQSLINIKESWQRESSRLNSLLELQKNFEGYQEGVRAILRQRQKREATANGIYGLVEDIIETEPQYECLVESVLGERLQHFIVQDHQETLKAVEYLKTQGAGRSSFIPLRLKPNPILTPASTVGGEAVPLMNLVKVKEEFTHLANYLFGDVWVVPDLRQAIDLWTRDSIWQTLVTLEGEVLHPSGVVTGGSKEQIGSGTFHRKREIRDLTQSSEELRQQIILKEQNQEQLLAQIKDLEAAIEELTQALHGQELLIVSETKELDQVQTEGKRWQQQLATLQLEENQLTEESAAIRKQSQRAKEDLQAAESRQKEKEESLSRQEEKIQQLKAEIESLAVEVTEAKVHLVALQEKKQNWEQNLERVRKAYEETTSLLTMRRQEVLESLELLAAAEEQGQRAEEEVKHFLAIRQEIQTHLGNKKEALLTLRENLAREEGRWKERRQTLQELSEKKNTFSLKLMELDLNLKHLLANVEEKYRLSPEALRGREDAGDYFSPETEARHKELKALIESMGDVNLLAIQEYEEAKNRLEFLTEQEADLIQSLEALNQAIKKINRTSRQRFASTFTAVNQKFKEIFTGLFNGGRAELVLADEANLLETGVDIIAQPPGKKLQNLSLLSGGEKALTAVALIFSLFLINPSPFCLMDEVDAPLDDANIGRFNKLIKELAQKYQIVLVTHNKRTMELADTLYGVTMEESGISKLVSVKLN